MAPVLGNADEVGEGPGTDPILLPGRNQMEWIAGMRDEVGLGLGATKGAGQAARVLKRACAGDTGRGLDEEVGGRGGVAG